MAVKLANFRGVGHCLGNCIFKVEFFLFLAVPVFRSICSILELEPSILLLFAALEPSILLAICSILELESCICHAICKPLLVVSCCVLVVGWCSWRNTPTTADGVVLVWV